MTDDLVKRLMIRLQEIYDRPHDFSNGQKSEAAGLARDRIEELEAKLARYDDLVADKINLRSENAALKAKLKWVGVDLRVINALDPEASMDGCSRYTLTTIVGLMGGKARDALAKLTGGKNE